MGGSCGRPCPAALAPASVRGGSARIPCAPGGEAGTGTEAPADRDRPREWAPPAITLWRGARAAAPVGQAACPIRSPSGAPPPAGRPSRHPGASPPAAGPAPHGGGEDPDQPSRARPRGSLQGGRAPALPSGNWPAPSVPRRRETARGLPRPTRNNVMAPARWARLGCRRGACRLGEAVANATRAADPARARAARSGGRAPRGPVRHMALGTRRLPLRADRGRGGALARVRYPIFPRHMA